MRTSRLAILIALFVGTSEFASASDWLTLTKDAAMSVPVCFKPDASCGGKPAICTLIREATGGTECEVVDPAGIFLVPDRPRGAPADWHYVVV